MRRFRLLVSCLAAFFTVSHADAPSTPEPLSINDGLNNRDATLSPDGHELYSTLVGPKNLTSVIVVSRRSAEGWSEPSLASFSGAYPDIEPMFTPDGRRLYFASKRPRDGSDTPAPDWDIWFVDRTEEGWGEPENAGEVVNTEVDEFYPSVTAGGELYFTAARPDAIGREDIFVARVEQGRFVRVENAGDGVNTDKYEFNAFVTPDERWLFFTSYGRADDLGGGDLYVCERQGSGWAPARHVAAPVNSDKIDYCPFVAGDAFYFTSERSPAPSPVANLDAFRRAAASPGNGLGDVYVVALEAVVAALEAAAPAAVD